VYRSFNKKTGDVIEISTSKGLAYVQYTHEYKEPPIYGRLIRVLQGFYRKRPFLEEINRIIEKPHRFQTFCPVHRMVNMGEWERVGNYLVPESAQDFPIFKKPANRGQKFLFKFPEPEEVVWSLWDGEKSWYVGKLSLKEQMKYPLSGSYPGISLVEAIETGVFWKYNLC